MVLVGVPLELVVEPFGLLGTLAALASEDLAYCRMHSREAAIDCSQWNSIVAVVFYPCGLVV